MLLQHDNKLTSDSREGQPGLAETDGPLNHRDAAIKLNFQTGKTDKYHKAASSRLSWLVAQIVYEGEI